MKEYHKPLPLTDTYKKIFAECINDGIFRYKMCVEDFPTPTHNGRGHSIWNFINGQIHDTLPKDEFVVLTSNKNSWEFVIIYEMKSQYLYLLTREENLKSLQKQYDKKLLHYFNAFSVLNERLLNNYERQVYQYNLLNEYSMYDDPEIINLHGSDLSKMLHELHEDVKQFVLISFKQKDDKVSKIYAEVPAYGFSPFYHEQWSYVLDVDYDIAMHNEDVVVGYENSDIDVSLIDNEEKIGEIDLQIENDKEDENTKENIEIL